MPIPGPSSGVIFDGDDTLWHTEPLYDEARQHARAVVEEAGIDGAEWESLQRSIDVANVPAFGYSPDRFPTSCAQAYEQLCARLGRSAEPNVVAGIRRAAQSVFERDPEIVSGARETLTTLRARGTRLALMTKGDLSVQKRRIAHSGLEHLFHVVRIVSEKRADTILETLNALSVDPRDAWMVGNSVRSDVLPAVDAGLRAIWIDAHVWEHERTHDHLVDERVVAVTSISDVPSVITSAAEQAAIAKPLG